MRKPQLWLLVLLAGSLGSVQAQDITSDNLLTRLQSKYPKTRFTAVNASPLAGIYEVVMGKNIAYTDAKGDFFLFGHVMDMANQRDITADRKKTLQRIDFNALPADSAITYVQGNGRRQMAVFSDPDCPYCRQLEVELAKLDNVTIHLYPYPLDGLHPDAMKKAVSVWCSKERAKAWRELLIHHIQPAGGVCDNPVAMNRQLAEKLGIFGTPTIISADGRQTSGALKASELDDWLDRVQ